MKHDSVHYWRVIQPSRWKKSPLHIKGGATPHHRKEEATHDNTYPHRSTCCTASNMPIFRSTRLNSSIRDYLLRICSE